MIMDTLVDDVGSFPLPPSVNGDTFSRAYQRSRLAVAGGEDPCAEEFTKKNFCDVVLESFRRKLKTGLDVVTYPQHYDGVKQVVDLIHTAMENGSYVVLRAPVRLSILR